MSLYRNSPEELLPRSLYLIGYNLGFVFRSNVSVILYSITDGNYRKELLSSIHFSDTA